MCPLRLILLFLSATLAGFLLFKNFKSSKIPEESVEESSPSSVPRSAKVVPAICSGFWVCVDMASGRYLWRNLGSSSSSSSEQS